MSNDSTPGDESIHALVATHAKAINAAAFEARAFISHDITPETLAILRSTADRCFVSAETLAVAHRDDDYSAIICRAELLAAAANDICVSAQRAAELASKVLQAAKEAASSMEDPESY